MRTPKIYFIGAGPGETALITVKGFSAVQHADCIIYDGLVNPSLLDHANPDAERISVAKRSGCHSMEQEQINALLVEKARQYKMVVRLKGGDPCLFGRAAEEISACIEAGIAFEIVPGVTAGLAAAEYAGIFLTNRDYASSVCLVTGHQAQGKDGDEPDWKWLARFNGSLVIYMGMETIGQITQKLLASGKPAQTPACVICRAVSPRQRVVKAPLSGIADLCKAEGLEAPAIIIIGTAAQGMNRADWFMQNRLFGKRVLLTRDAAGNRVFAEKFAACGAEPVLFDSIDIIDLTDSSFVSECLRNLSSYDWIIFTSANGITRTLDRLHKSGLDARAFASTRIACIGRPTADKLAEYGLKADFVPCSFTSEAMAAEMIAAFDLRDQKILLLRSQVAPKDIVRAFTNAGAQVTDASVYNVVARRQEAESVNAICQDLEAGRIDYVIFTSDSTACAFINSVPQGLLRPGRPQIVSIGPATTRSLERMGLAPDIEASVHTLDGILDALQERS
ncbi:MAG: uroporphyrinogen-III C-methyltransferase [Planctomycetaceae bacterium]|nr:uroporphyrinogen-III C-methyltransferase [Planctomycetaceae bacterium]